MKTYDIIIIGAGSGGLNIAAFMNRVGFKVLLIDKSAKNIGGDCLNTGCVPSKVLLSIAKKVHEGESLQRFGVSSKGSVQLKEVMQYVKERQDVFRKHESKEWFERQGISVLIGEARFSSKRSVRVDGNEYSAKKILLATGSKPRKLDISGEDLPIVHTNETIFNLDKLPKKLIVIGGGPIGIELGQAFLRLGSEVSVIHRGEEILKREDPAIVKVLQKELKKEGMQFVFETSPVRIEKNGIVLKPKNGKEYKLSCDAILVATGRVVKPELDLENAGIKLGKDGKIIVDKYLRTTNKNVLVAGDIAGGPMFTHAAEVHASVIIRNFFSPFKKKVSYDTFAWVTYTDPEIATFGLSERELKRKGVTYERMVLDHNEDDRTIIEDGAGLTELLLDNKGKILGGSMVAKNAGELVQEFILAMQEGIPLSKFLEKVYPYPVHARVNKRLAGNYMGRKLTPFAKKIMRWLY